MNLPPEFVSRMQSELGSDWDELDIALSSPSPTSIRLNSKKVHNNNLSDKVPWSDSGFYLNERPAFSFDPIFHAGGYYVQEASSMFIEQAMKQYIKGDVLGLDLCAAPGGKSTLLLSLISPSSLLVSNEYVRSRANILTENMMKWGYNNYFTTNNTPEAIGKMNHIFDFILVDAPCSGEGMFRKDEQAITEWCLSNVEKCSVRQQDILQDVWSSLKPGGFLFYSTCTYNQSENENIVKYIKSLGADILTLEIDPSWGISQVKIDEGEGYHFYPHKLKGEGFFFAVLQKRYTNEVIRNKKQKNRSNNKKQTIELSKYLLESEKYFVEIKNNLIYAIPKIFQDHYYLINENLNILNAGILIGEIKGSDVIPNQSLALSLDLNSSMFDVYKLSYDEAIAYLKCQPLYLENTPKGFILLQYKGVNIGFVKNIGSRANNLYPNEWRIRSNKVPEQQNIIF